MENLQLTLENIWFQKTKTGEKKEDYRAITPYFCNRLLLYNGEKKSKIWWQQKYFDKGDKDKIIQDIGLFCSFKPFEYNIMTLGYPNKDDSERILKLEHKGVEIRTGNTVWGAEKGIDYFVVKHGAILN